MTGGGPSLQVSSDPSVDLSENRRLVTVLFADLSGSTPLGEHLDPEDLRRILTSYFAALAREIQRYGGTIDKYIGDAVMAVFGAPVAHEDDAERAISAAIAMQAAIAQLNEDLARRHGTRLALRIGVNTGEVVAGLLAGDVQGAYTVVGDTVNTAQRFESAAPPGSILVGQSTRDLTRRAFDFETLAPLQLKGKAEPQPAYRVLAPRYESVDPSAVPLVGRAPELAQLRRAFDTARDGAGGMVHLTGEAGIGKSRLVRELRGNTDLDVLQVVGRCVSFEVDRPYALMARLLRDIVRVQSGQDEEAAREGIERVLVGMGSTPDPLDTALLLDILGYGERSGFDPQSRQRVLLRLVRRMLHAYTEQAPLLVVAEDLHWADSASIALLVQLTRDIAARRCLLLTTSRPGWAPSWDAEIVTLDALPQDGARVLVEAAFNAPVDDALADAILTRTGGNPFFIEEVVRGLREADVLAESAGRVSAKAGATPRVPATVQEVLEARLDRLPQAPKRVLQVAAVCGRLFRRRVVEQLAPDDRPSDSIGILERESFILAYALEPEPTYAFRHALIQEVAYNRQLQSQRRTTHAAIGEALEILYADRVDELVGDLAFHYGRSDNDDKALVWLVRAADRARALFANEEALAQYRAALDRASPGDGALEIGTIQERIGDVQHLIARYDDAIASFSAAREQIPEPAAATSARLQRKIGTALRIKGANAEAAAVFDDALRVLGSGASTHVEAAHVRLQIGQLLWRGGQYTAAEKALAQAVEIGETLGQDDVVAEGFKQLGNIPLFSGDPNDAIGLYRRSQRIYERLEDIAGIATVRMNVGTSFGRLGRWDESLSELSAALAHFERIGDQWHIGVVHNNMGELHRERGDLERAIDAYERALSIATEVGYAAGVANALTGLGMARVESGAIDRGRADLLEAEARFTALGRSMYMPHIHRFLASAELAVGNLEAAEQSAARSIEFARAANAKHEEAITQRVQGEIALARGDPTRARNLLEASRQALAEVGEAAELARTEALLQRLAART